MADRVFEMDRRGVKITGSGKVVSVPSYADVIRQGGRVGDEHGAPAAPGPHNGRIATATYKLEARSSIGEGSVGALPRQRFGNLVSARRQIDGSLVADRLTVAVIRSRDRQRRLNCVGIIGNPVPGRIKRGIFHIEPVGPGSPRQHWDIHRRGCGYSGRDKESVRECNRNQAQECRESAGKSMPWRAIAGGKRFLEDTFNTSRRKCGKIGA